MLLCRLNFVVNFSVEMQQVTNQTIDVHSKMLFRNCISSGDYFLACVCTFFAVDMEDGGAAHFAQTVREIKKR